MKPRLIPACAGKTQGVLLGLSAAGGSSPRVRGKLDSCFAVDSFFGLIPACAGKTGAKCRATSASPAHPRVCGENDFEDVPLSTEIGSSPRVRGKLGRGLRRRSLLRLIPACAGKTRRLVQQQAPCRAHPRVCGENELMNFTAAALSGSSPRVRGKRERISSGFI